MGPSAARRIELLNYVLGGVAVLVGLFILSRPEVLGLLCGALLGALNFSAIRRLVERQVAAQKTGRGGASAALVFPKMIILIAAVAGAIFLLPIAPVYLAVGFSIFLISIAIESVRYMTSPTPTNEDAR